MSGSFFGHPRGLATLFFTEMWERFTYYGMRAVLVLFLVAQVSNGGFGIDDKTATAIYGLYTAGTYLAALPGGWIADRWLGLQRAVFCGGVLIALGHLSVALSGIFGKPPIKKPGAKPQASSKCAAIAVVVVLPCVPATTSGEQSPSTKSLSAPAMCV